MQVCNTYTFTHHGYIRARARAWLETNFKAETNVKAGLWLFVLKTHKLKNMYPDLSSSLCLWRHKSIGGPITADGVVTVSY